MQEFEDRLIHWINTLNEVYIFRHLESPTVVGIWGHYSRLFCRSAAALLEDPWDWVAAVAAPDRNRVAFQLKHHWQQHTPYWDRFALDLPMGRRRVVQRSLVLPAAAGGVPTSFLPGADQTYYVSILQDVTGVEGVETALGPSLIAQLKQTLQESQQKYRTLFEILPAGVAITDAHGQLLEVNQASEAILGLGAEAQTERTYDDPQWQLLNPDGSPMPPAAYASVRALRENRPIVDQEMGFQRSDGQVRWLQVSATPIPLDAYGVAITYTDITPRKQAETALAQQEQQFRTLAENSPDCILRCDRQGRILYANPICRQQLDLSVCTLTFCLPAPWQDHVREVFATGVSQAMESRLTPPDSSDRLFDCRLVPEFNGDQVASVLVVARDITALKQLQQDQQRQVDRERLLSTITQTLRASLALPDLLHIAVTEVRQLLGVDRALIYRFAPDWSGTMVAESVESPWTSVLGTTLYDPCFTADLATTYRQGRINRIDDITAHDLAECYVELLSSLQIRANLAVPITTPGGLWGLLCLNQCSSQRPWQDWEVGLIQRLCDQLALAIHQVALVEQLQLANRQLRQWATTDPLTQLANRRALEGHLQQEWQRMVRQQQPLAVVLADIDCFKQYNDTYGHPAGDRCLRAVADILGQAVQRAGDLAGRYGGEEFVLVLPNTDETGATRIVETIQTALAQRAIPHQASPHRQQLTLSFGIAWAIPHPQATPQTLVDMADQALYEAKLGGRNGYRHRHWSPSTGE